MSYSNANFSMGPAPAPAVPKSMLQAFYNVGVVIAGGLLGAVFQIAHDELCVTLANLRLNSQLRQARHPGFPMAILGSELDLTFQEAFLHSRNAYAAGLRLLTHPGLSSRDRRVIRLALDHASNPAGD